MPVHPGWHFPLMQTHSSLILPTYHGALMELVNNMWDTGKTKLPLSGLQAGISRTVSIDWPLC